MAYEIAANEGLWLFGYLDETEAPGFSLAAIVVGEVTEQWTTPEIVEAIAKMLAFSHAGRHRNEYRPGGFPLTSPAQRPR